jgi:hypothetical protein
MKFTGAIFALALLGTPALAEEHHHHHEGGNPYQFQFGPLWGDAWGWEHQRYDHHADRWDEHGGNQGSNWGNRGGGTSVNNKYAPQVAYASGKIVNSNSTFTAYNGGTINEYVIVETSQTQGAPVNIQQ